MLERITYHIQYDAGEGREQSQHSRVVDVSCSQDPCTYSIFVKPSVIRLYAVVYDVELAPYEVELAHVRCEDDITYLLLDATKAPVEWVSPTKMKKCD